VPRTPKLCGWSGSPKCLKTATRQGRCGDHQFVPFEGAKDRWKANRPANYAATRNRVIRDAKGRCAICGGQGEEVDKIVPNAEGGSWTRENLRLLCKPCHDIKTEEDAQRGRLRRRR
jgi:5-methylcytosine-specific restriction protein A